MLPDKKELNDETIKQISGGFEEKLGGIGNEDGELPPANINCLYTCSCCGKMYSAMTQGTDGLCPNCEPEPIAKVVPVGDIKTTVPDLPKKLVKIH